MSSINTSLHRGILKAGVASALVLAAMPAVAQEAAQSAELTETIVVTGSRIARPELQSSSPVAVVGAQDFQLAGAVNVEDVLLDMPQVMPSLTAASNNPGGGVARIDLRGIGPSRTLVLVNGRRYVSYDEQQMVDLNTVPSALIERVDVVTGGRSAVYGSDAIAGVVNFILKKDFEGVQVSGNYRLTEKGDGDTYTIDALIGGNFADGKGNATLYMSYAKRKSIMQGDRSFASRAIVDDLTNNKWFYGGSTSIEGTKITLPTLAGDRRFDESGSMVMYNDATDQYNHAPENYLQTPNERWFIGGFAHYEINDHIELFAETQFINSRAPRRLAPTPVTANNVQIDPNSPFLSASARQQLAALPKNANGYVTATRIERRMSEAGPRAQVDDRNAYRIVTGARGDIASGWAYEAYYSFAQNRNIQTQEGNISRSRFLQSLQTAMINGKLQCASLDARNAGCVPLNIFGPGKASPEALKYITVPTTNLNSIQQQVANVSVNNGELFDLGAGPAGIAFGAEWQSYSGSYRPDFYLASGDVIGFNAGEPTKGSYSVKELFGEVVVPLLAELPGAHSLEFNGAIRYSDYSNAVGSALSYAAGLTYAPIKDISFRGQYQRAVRAPTINQLFQGVAVGYPRATDPCATKDAVNDPTLRSLCIAQGVPADKIGSLTAVSQIRSFSGGYAQLEEEKADTYTVGAVFQPSFLPRFTMTVDYYNITVSNFIGAGGPGTPNIITACYGEKANGWKPYDTGVCRFAPRAANGQLEDVVTINANLGKLKTSGIDFEARYSFDVPFGVENDGRVDLRLNGTRLIEYKLNPFASAPGLVNDCLGRFGSTCGDPYAKWRWSAGVTYATGPLTASFKWQHLSSVRDDNNSVNYLYTETLDSYDIFDLSANYQLNETMDFTFGINNLFNKKPPLAGSNQQQANTWPSTYDVFGRRYFISATAKF